MNTARIEIIATGEDDYTIIVIANDGSEHEIVSIHVEGNSDKAMEKALHLAYQAAAREGYSILT